MSFRDRLTAREARLGRPVRVGLVGAGQMGRGFAAQLGRTPGVQVSAIADVQIERASEALSGIGVTEVRADSSEARRRRRGHRRTRIASATNNIYSVCRGDEPVETKILVDYARDLGFEVIAAGKGKNNPLDQRATPASLEAEAIAKKMNPKMLCSFVDGSKAMIEMAALANTTGLGVSTRGMHGPP